jgi:hypothetical protein
MRMDRREKNAPRQLSATFAQGYDTCTLSGRAKEQFSVTCVPISVGRSVFPTVACSFQEMHALDGTDHAMRQKHTKPRGSILGFCVFPLLTHTSSAPTQTEHEEKSTRTMQTEREEASRKPGSFSLDWLFGGRSMVRSRPPRFIGTGKPGA